MSQGLTTGKSYPAKDCLPKRFDEMSTETNDGDIVRALRKQMEEMNLQMNAMMKINTEVMRGGCLGAFGTISAAIALRRVDLPAPTVLPATNCLASPPPTHRPDEELGQPGN